MVFSAYFLIIDLGQALHCRFILLCSLSVSLEPQTITMYKGLNPLSKRSVHWSPRYAWLSFRSIPFKSSRIFAKVVPPTPAKTEFEKAKAIPTQVVGIRHSIAWELADAYVLSSCRPQGTCTPASLSALLRLIPTTSAWETLYLYDIMTNKNFPWYIHTDSPSACWIWSWMCTDVGETWEIPPSSVHCRSSGWSRDVLVVHAGGTRSNKLSYVARWRDQLAWY